MSAFYMALGEFELLVLLAVMRLRGRAYGVPVLEEICARTGRNVSRGSVYVTLDRLVRKGQLKSFLAEATAERGGRPKCYYQLTPAGAAALRETIRALNQMQQGLSVLPERQ